MMFEELKAKLLQDDRIRQAYAHYFHKIEVPAKTILLQEGEIAKKMYWIEKGCIRVWFNNDGEDITSQFFFENNMVSSIESFRKHIASLVNIETIEPCILWYASKEHVEQMLEELSENPVIRRMLMDIVFERTFDYMKYAFSFIKSSPEQRYLALMKERPQLLTRIPQHYIASHLGISRVHLSRIRSKLAKRKDIQIL